MRVLIGCLLLGVALIWFLWLLVLTFGWTLPAIIVLAVVGGILMMS